MNLDEDFLGDAILFDDEADAPGAVWTVDELDHSADLGSIRSAWTRNDDPST
jgi:hypothetical protein